jgi:hypothetical protein
VARAGRRGRSAEVVEFNEPVALLKMVAVPPLLVSWKLIIESLVMVALPAVLVLSRVISPPPVRPITDGPAVAEFSSTMPPPLVENVGGAEAASAITPAPFRINVPGTVNV